MTVFFIIMGVVLLYVLGQALMLRPNPREQALMALREAARKLGLQPRLVPPPEWLKVEVPGRLVGCYILLAGEGESLPYWRIEHRPEGWCTCAGNERLLPMLELPSLPGLLAVEARANAVSLYWTEGAEAGDLPALHALLGSVIDKSKKNQ